MSTKLLYSIDNKLRTLEEFIQLWSRFFLFFADAQVDLQSTPEVEDQLALAIRELSLRVYPLSELTAEVFDDSSRILKLLADVQSLATLKEMADSSYDKLQVEWHEIYLKLNVAKGKLLHRMTPKQLAAYEAAA